MKKYSGLLVAAALAGGALAVSTTGATAAYGRHGCNCGPTTSKHYKTIHVSKSVTRYHDVSRVQRVPRLHRIVTVTRIQPIIRIHDVTRVHHHTIYYPQNTYANVTQHLAPIQYTTHSVINTYDCNCGY